MKNLLLTTLLLLGLTVQVFSQKVTRIACIGNSITFGAGIEDRQHNAYPAQLQSLLGENYEVMNFGVSGATLLQRGDNPYQKTKAFANGLSSAPGIVIIKLGSNDAKKGNRILIDEFESDYKSLIKAFQQLPSKPEIILCLPVPSFKKDSNTIYDPVIVKDINPKIRQIAFDMKLEVIDLHQLFMDKRSLFPDGIHPNADGAKLIAERLYEHITRRRDQSFDIFKKIKFNKTSKNFYGFESAEFVFNGRNCKVVKPKYTAPGRPWIWRARFWGHEPQTDISLLERGFHVVYCDVAELFGNREAVEAWNHYYSYLRKLGLSSKVTLEGMSRGGVYVYNWAMANPSKVSCIYADAPVLDLRSWPGGKGIGKGSPYDWERFKKDYGLDEAQASGFKNSPLDHAEQIAELGFPMLHVVGDADDIVPVSENTGPFEKRIKAAGGSITVIHKPGVGHHPHSLANPKKITAFILEATYGKE